MSVRICCGAASRRGDTPSWPNLSQPTSCWPASIAWSDLPPRHARCANYRRAGVVEFANASGGAHTAFVPLWYLTRGAVMEPNKCAHPACNCTVEKGGPFGKYCSEHCKEARDIIELHCDCKHPGCGS